MGTWLKRYYRKIKIMSQTRILGLMVRLGILDLDFEQGFDFFTAQIEMVIVHFRSWVIFVPLVKTEDGLLLRLSTNRYVAVSYRVRTRTSTILSALMKPHLLFIRKDP